MHFFPFIAQIKERQRLLANEKCCCHKPQKIVPAEKLENLCGGEEKNQQKQQVF